MNRLRTRVGTGGLLAACACMWMAPANVAAQFETTPAKPAAPGAPAKDKGTIKPGKDRWLVKTASDLDAGQIQLKPVKTSVENLLQIPRPSDLPLDASSPWLQEHRAGPAETTIWTVEADVTRCQLMPDGDYRVTIRGASGQTMVLEMPNPDPSFVNPSGPFAAGIKTARAQFDSKEQPARTPKELTRHAVISGIGFFSRSFGKQETAKGNLIQLHPVLSIEWLDKPTNEFVAPPPQQGKPDSSPKPK